MTRLNQRATKYTYTPANPAVFGSQATYPEERGFNCRYHSNTAIENVNAGRNASDENGVLYYYPREVSFKLEDRIVLDGLKYTVIYVPRRAYSKPIDYVQVRLMP